MLLHYSKVVSLVFAQLVFIALQKVLDYLNLSAACFIVAASYISKCSPVRDKPFLLSIILALVKPYIQKMSLLGLTILVQLLS